MKEQWDDDSNDDDDDLEMIENYDGLIKKRNPQPPNPQIIDIQNTEGFSTLGNNEHLSEFCYLIEQL